MAQTRHCGICGVPVAVFRENGTERTPFGLVPKYELVEVNMGKFGRGGNGSYRCTEHSGEKMEAR